MNAHDMYLIQEEDYLRHIDEKLELYAMLCQLVHTVLKQPACLPNAITRYTAETYAQKCEQLFKSWDIPQSYLVTGDTDELIKLMENELIAPEDAGYVPEDGFCRCFDGECTEHMKREYSKNENKDLSEFVSIGRDILSALERLIAAIQDGLDYGD